MQTAQINTKGLIQIHQALGQHHKLGGEHFTPAMLNGWAAEAENSFSNGNGCSFEIRGFDAIHGSPVVVSITEEGYEVTTIND